MSAASIIATLWSTSDVDKMTDDQLAQLANSETTTNSLENLAKLMEGLGCLIADDENTGQFQSREDVAFMLWGFADTVNTAAKAAFVAGEAAAVLRHRSTTPHLAGRRSK